ncbi:MAG TPA: NAD(P)/FAD-dependent oxidoreductase [Mycobacteriales bacterium]|nr:NAD(P)/FAD-dependent oxidoreductase [Mycobacteriales bacterium]
MNLPADVQEVDVVVVGGGPAGLAAASWIARYRRSVVVVDSGDYRSRMVERSHGYLGRDPQTPLDLISRGREEVLAYPTAQIRQGRVTGLARRDGGLFDVTLEHSSLVAHRVVLATGVRDAVPDVEGFDEHYGASVFHCPACDGYEARDRDVVALGWDPQLVGFSATLKNWATSVTVVTNGRRFQGDDACRVQMADNEVDLVEEDALAFEGTRGDLKGVRLQSGRVLPASLVFFSVAHHPRVDLAAALGCDLDDQGYIAVDGEGAASVPGVFAAGDCVPGLQLVQVAAGQGVIAGVACAQSFFGQIGAPTSPTPAPEPTVPGDGG